MAGRWLADCEDETCQSLVDEGHVKCKTCRAGDAHHRSFRLRVKFELTPKTFFTLANALDNFCFHRRSLLDPQQLVHLVCPCWHRDNCFVPVVEMTFECLAGVNGLAWNAGRIRLRSDERRIPKTRKQKCCKSSRS